MSEDQKLPPGWIKSTPRPQEPAIEWVSIEKLLDDYTIPVLAEAIEKLDVQTHDDTGRRILANNCDVDDTKSKAFALSHLAQRHYMIHNPGPDNSLYDEMLEIVGSPLDLFGWPTGDLPDLDSVNPHHSSSFTTPTSKSPETWIVQAQGIAKKYIDRNKLNDLHPSLDDTSEYVAKELRTLKVYGSHQKPLGSGYIKRKALQGTWWKNRHAPIPQ